MSERVSVAAYVVGFALAAFGAGMAAAGLSWPAVMLVALGVALVLGLAVVGHFSDVRENLSLKSDVAALKMALHRLEQAQAKTQEDAKAALTGVGEVRTMRARTPGY